MPVHDWTRVDAGLFHAFHQQWITALSAALNGGVLPPDYFALPEQNIKGPIPDVAADSDDESAGGVAVAASPPQVRLVRHSEADIYLDKVNHITVRHRHGEVGGVIEIVSPGNKGSKAEFKAFIEKSAALIRHKIHLLVIDLFPATKRDPQGIHKAIWDEFEDEEFALPAKEPLVVASYDAGPPQVAYVETLGVGAPLPEMPLFLRPEVYVPTPLEATYQTTWGVLPRALKGLLEP